MLTRIKRWWTECRKYGHTFYRLGPSHDGERIRCVACRKTDEYIPGVNEPEGYK